jgi:hypothetical protein
MYPDVGKRFKHKSNVCYYSISCNATKISDPKKISVNFHTQTHTHTKDTQNGKKFPLKLRRRKNHGNLWQQSRVATFYSNLVGEKIIQSIRSEKKFDHLNHKRFKRVNKIKLYNKMRTYYSSRCVCKRIIKSQMLFLAFTWKFFQSLNQ